ncbi:thioesterase family protein [Nocardioides gilvus]|uniref:thioesterase family protein n=1 Tax=Nocardioides gilvus TaxID=1735589 RepID=UPI000D7481EE|nr:thioesterase family protein [Nocardioides gilvus]
MIIGADWRGKEGIYGGKVAACLADAVQIDPDLAGLELASMWVEFSGTVFPGPVEVVAETVHRGRSTATVRATLVQGRQRASAVAKLIASGGRTPLEPRRWAALPDPEKLHDFQAPWGELEYDSKFQIRVAGQSADEGIITTRAWVRTQADTHLGHGGAEAALLDLLPPGLFFADPVPAYVPTIDFALHLNPNARVRPGQWLWGEMRTEWADEEFCADTGTLYRPDGTFVARGTQTRRVVR